MKTTLLGMFLMAFATLLVMPSVATAQIGDVEINVPFEFWVADTKLAAGKYHIKQMNEVAAGDSSMEIVSADGRVSVGFLTLPASLESEPEKGGVNFKDYGGKRYLNQVFVAGNKDGVEVLPGRSEKKHIKSGKTAKMHKHPAS